MSTFKVENYSSFGTAMFSLLRTILGDFDYAEIEQANRILAPIYFLSYIFLVFFVLLNMFLAIINDSYADVKTEIAIAPEEMQMTEYISRGFFNILRKLGWAHGERSEIKREINVTIRKIREALTKCGFSDLEIEMFFARYNIDPLAEVGNVDVEKLLKELEDILGNSPSQEALGGYVHVKDFISQQERLEQIDRTIGQLVEQVKSLLLKLDQMENVKKVRQK
ncbi:hypothetical protein NQ317_001803 [Molorchus minor]|uniref:Polycystin cation channel PKD1/PKD2 domain-containing protein n=1 Tax=Molorchus minor TaxID=1323400 RepID=A0ABQ9JUJ7_9CUCU|nr:hypothetical protein NQ317_001803 [Molorchus minor]